MPAPGLPLRHVEVQGIEDREHALLWTEEENLLGRRYLSDDQRAVIRAQRG